MTGHNVFDPETGQPRLLSEQCSSCIGRAGNLMDLRAGRVQGMVREALAGGGAIICHQTLGYAGQPAARAAYCRWFYDKFGPRCNLLRIYDRLGGFLEVTPPDEGHEPQAQ
jgi:hypothetical protein